MMHTEHRYLLNVKLLGSFYDQTQHHLPGWMTVEGMPDQIPFVSSHYSAALDMQMDALPEQVAERMFNCLSKEQPDKDPSIPPGLNLGVTKLLLRHGVLTRV